VYDENPYRSPLAVDEARDNVAFRRGIGWAALWLGIAFLVFPLLLPLSMPVDVALMLATGLICLSLAITSFIAAYGYWHERDRLAVWMTGLVVFPPLFAIALSLM